MNLIVNGDLANVTDITDLANTTVGGAAVSLQQANVNLGTIIINGNIKAFSVGGQEFWVDDVCVENRLPQEIFTDGFESGNTSAWSSTVP